MSNFYIKNKEGKYIPIELSSVVNKDLDNRLIIVRVGTDDHPASMSDLDATEESFRQADIINDLDVSVILTPFQIDVGVEYKENIENKSLYIQISSGDDVGGLEEYVRKMYKRIISKHDVEILPTPLKIKDYNKVKDTLRRCNIRKERRGRVKG